MPLLAGLVVVFAGISGQQDHRVETQLRAVAAQLDVRSAKLSAADLATIGHHSEGAREVVQRLHVDGVIAGEYVKSGAHATVRVVIYNGDGGLRSLSEIPMSARTLGADDLESLRTNLADEVSGMMPAAPPPPPPAPKLAIAPEAAAAPPPKQQRRKPAPKPEPEPEPEIDPAPTPAAPTAADTTAAPAADNDSVSVADLEALTGGAASVDAAAPEPAAPESDLHLRGAVGLGFATRSFAGPSTMPSYASSAVGVVRVAGSVQPTRAIVLSGLAERTLEMTTPLDREMAPTSFSRWELSGDYALTQGTVAVRPMLGLGHRAFAIDSADPGRSPAIDYSYAMLGGRLAAALGSHVALQAHAAFEPVFAGTDPTAMAYGAATRWAFDTGAALEVRAWPHVFARVAADYQRFSWSWAQAGARGAGGAADSYPSGTLSLGAEY